MLGWFKKKFSKTKESPAPDEKQVQDSIVPEESPISQSEEAEPALTEDSEIEARPAAEEPLEEPDTQQFEEPSVVDKPKKEEQQPEIETPIAAEEPTEQPQMTEEEEPPATEEPQKQQQSEDENEPEPDSTETISESLPTEQSGTESMFQRISSRLAKTKESLVYRMDTLFLGRKEIDADLFDELEEILITADLGSA